MGAFQLEFNLCVLVVPDRLRNLDPRKSTWIWGWSGGGRAGEAGDPDPIRQHSEPSSLMAQRSSGRTEEFSESQQISDLTHRCLPFRASG
jgi:hypothetical protein